MDGYERNGIALYYPCGKCGTPLLGTVTAGSGSLDWAEQARSARCRECYYA